MLTQTTEASGGAGLRETNKSRLEPVRTEFVVRPRLMRATGHLVNFEHRKRRHLDCKEFDLYLKSLSAKKSVQLALIPVAQGSRAYPIWPTFSRFTRK